MFALALLALPPTRDGVGMVRDFKSSGDLPHSLFREAVDLLPGARKIVFVRYVPGEGCQPNLIQNHPPMATALEWIVNERGTDDIRLLRAAPHRTPYRFDVMTNTMELLSVESAPAPP